jgi:hypothetical protein
MQFAAGTNSSGYFQTFLTDSTERMRLTSTGLGIGTSSPAYPLTVAGDAQLGSNSNAPTVIIGKVTPTANGDAGIQFRHSNSTKNWSISSNRYASSGLEFTPSTANGGTTYTTPVMILDTTGNLGLGVTPPSSSTTVGIFVTGENNLIGSTTNGASYGANIYRNSGVWKYTTSSTASLYQQFAGAHYWYTGASGTAGNTVSFTQAMTLDASGRLLVGTTSATANYNVVATQSADTSAGMMVENTSNTSSASAIVRYKNSDAALTTYTGMGSPTRSSYSGLGANVLSMYTNSTAGISLSVDAAGPITFNTNSIERARIDSSGNLLVGTTSGTGNRLDVVGGGMRVSASGTSFNLLEIQDTVNQSGATYVQFLNSAGGNIGNITRVTTTNAVTYNTTSDYRLKTVTGAVTGQGERIDALKPIDYLWTEGGQQARGFLAHEFQTVYPSSVTGDKDAVDAKGNPKYQAMQAATSEVIADLVAEIQSLRQRLSAANL